MGSLRYVAFALSVVAVVAVADARGLPYDNVAGQGCVICEQLAAEAEVFLSDPAIVKQAISLLETSICTVFVANLSTKCVELVETYVPVAVGFLEAQLSPDTICPELSLCPPGPPPAQQVAKGKERCELCLLAAANLLAFLGNNDTITQVIAAAHVGCSHFKNPKAIAECDQVVDEYGPQLITILQAVTPEEFCTLLDLCAPSLALEAAPPTSSALVSSVQSAILASKGDTCLLCHYLVIEARLKLKQPDTQAKIVEFLETTCKKVPNFEDKCQEAIDLYAPVIFDNMDILLDPSVICKELKMCGTGLAPLQGDSDSKATH